LSFPSFDLALIIISVLVQYPPPAGNFIFVGDAIDDGVVGEHIESLSVHFAFLYQMQGTFHSPI
jgi:hypothetical protein